MWLAAMLAATVLIIPFRLLTLLRQQWFASVKEGWLPTAYVACAAVSGMILTCTTTAPFVIRAEEIVIPNLPAAFDGFRIANFGDVHVGKFIDADELREGIDAVNARKVDLVVVSGDLVDDVSQLEDTMSALETSSAPQKTIAVLGNHEEMGDLASILDVYKRHSQHITLLVNENVSITRGGATLYIAGVDFPMFSLDDREQVRREQNTAMRRRIDKAFAGLEAGKVIIAVAHNPMFFPFAASSGAQLTIASHTHGGQLQLFGQPIVPLYRYRRGVYRLGNAYLDVSAGFGHWLPIRFGVRREIVIDTLRSH